MLVAEQSVGNPHPTFFAQGFKYAHFMVSIISLQLVVFMLYRIAHHDLKTHLIRDFDLVMLFIFFTFFFEINLVHGGYYFVLLLLLNIITRASIGFGDVKLALILGSAMNSLLQLVISIDVAWIIGGVWALISKRKSIPFAPAMILGAVIGQISISFR
jgi:prepilin signal peptidase PulO-like enzyme (type II secretory pathway)